MPVTLKNISTDSGLINSALRYFDSVINSEKYDARKCAEEFYYLTQNDPNGAVRNGAIIFGIPLIWKEDVLFNNEELTEKDEYIYETLNNFFQELKQVASKNYVENGEGFVRLAVPPKEAYEYKGHNKLDIKNSTIASALLYKE